MSSPKNKLIVDSTRAQSNGVAMHPRIYAHIRRHITGTNVVNTAKIIGGGA